MVLNDVSTQKEIVAGFSGYFAKCGRSRGTPENIEKSELLPAIDPDARLPNAMSTFDRDCAQDDELLLAQLIHVVTDTTSFRTNGGIIIELLSKVINVRSALSW
jgi:hypothetical protein